VLAGKPAAAHGDVLRLLGQGKPKDLRRAPPAACKGPDYYLCDILIRETDTRPPVHRVAKDNTLQPASKRGRITNTHPLIISVDDEQRAQVSVKNGLGHVQAVLTDLRLSKIH
jgi:hypothetical protein